VNPAQLLGMPVRIFPVQIDSEETDDSPYQQVIHRSQSNTVVTVQEGIDEREDSCDGDNPVGS